MAPSSRVKAQMKAHMIAVSIGITLIFASLSCKSPGRLAAPPPVPEPAQGPILAEPVTQLLFVDSLRVRRPEGKVIDPKESPGGTDYRRKPAPDEKLDCQTVSSFLSAQGSGQKLRACLSSIHDSVQVTYRLMRDAQPVLVLQKEENTPPCLLETLPKLPLPRELVYVGAVYEESRFHPGYCYSSRIDLEADRVMGFKVPKGREFLTLKFPLSTKLDSQVQLNRLLGAWVLSPFWNPEVDGIAAKMMPDHLCRQCMAQGWDFRKDLKTSPVWPEDSPP
jgi:hypothetical protein